MNDDEVLLLDLPMPIWTPRLCLKPREVGEGAVLNAAICESLEHLAPWLPFAQTRPTLSESEAHCRRALAQFLLRENFTLSIYARSSGELLGSTGFHRPNWKIPAFEIGYWIGKSHTGQGYVTEAVNAMTRYGFAVLGARRLEIRCDSENRRSQAVMTRLGYAQEGLLRDDSVDPAGNPRSTLITSRCDLQGLPPLNVSWGQ